MNGGVTGRKWAARDHANFKIWSQAPRDCTLYFYHTLLCHCFERKYGVMLEGCMGQRYSTQLGGSQSLKGFERIILVATVRLVVSKYIQRCGFFWKITHLPFVFGTSGPRRPTLSIAMQPSQRLWLSFGPLLAWREGAMHQRSSNKKCYTIIESTELRRTHTANRSTILFNLRGTLAFSHVER